MVKKVVADDGLLGYLKSLQEDHLCCVGLILGQRSASKCFVVHLTRTPRPNRKSDDANVDVEKADDSGNSDSFSYDTIDKFTDIPVAWVAEHAKQATRTLPGGMHVLGIFVITADDIFARQTVHIKNILHQIRKQLLTNPFISGIPSASSENLVLHFNPRDTSFACRTFDVTTNAVKLVEWKFVARTSAWKPVECKYLLDQRFPIEDSNANLSLKTHLQEILKHEERLLERARIMIDGVVKRDDELLVSCVKGSNNKKITFEDDEPKAMQVNILMPCIDDTADGPLVINCCGEMHLVGQVASRVFLHEEATFSEAVRAVKEDILRSLAVRLEMHWDSLIAEEVGSPEEKSSVHEPPRRVLIRLPGHNRVALSDYLFPGEGPSEALISLEELLDIKVDEENVLSDVEGLADPADLEAMDGTDKGQGVDDVAAKGDQSDRLFLAVGLGLAILFGLLSYFFQWLTNYLYP